MNSIEYQQIVDRIHEFDEQVDDLKSKRSICYQERSKLQSIGCGLELVYLHAPTAIYDRLQKAGFTTIDQVALAILSAGPNQITIEGFGKKRWHDLQEHLKQRGYMSESRQILEDKIQRYVHLSLQYESLENKLTTIVTERDKLASLTGDNVLLKDLGLRITTYNRLSTVGYTTVGGLIMVLMANGPTAVMAIRGFGSKCWDDLLERLSHDGYMPSDLKSQLERQFANTKTSAN